MAAIPQIASFYHLKVPSDGCHPQSLLCLAVFPFAEKLNKTVAQMSRDADFGACRRTISLPACPRGSPNNAAKR